MVTRSQAIGGALTATGWKDDDLQGQPREENRELDEAGGQRHRWLVSGYLLLRFAQLLIPCFRLPSRLAGTLQVDM